MKIEQGKRDFYSNTNARKSIQFGVADVAAIMTTVVRYQHPQKSIVRELSANAIDANREVKNSNIPIILTIPNYNNGYFAVEDFGPGISPSRLEDVYSMIGGSTKRDTNKQQGGFGIGAKSPFGYTDQFRVITRVSGTEYEYVMYRNENDEYKIDLVKEEGTIERNGTKIIVPVKRNDYYDFRSAIYYYGQWMETLPTIIGGEEVKRKIPDMSGKGWIYFENFNEDINLLVDRVPYYGTFTPDYRGLIYTFDTGELDIVQTRENVIVNEKLNNKIKASYSDFAKEIDKKIAEQLKTKTSLQEVCNLLNETAKFASHRYDYEFEFKGTKYIYNDGMILNDSFKGKVFSASGVSHNFVKNYVAVSIPESMLVEDDFGNNRVIISSYRRSCLRHAFGFSKKETPKVLLVVEGADPNIKIDGALLSYKLPKQNRTTVSPRKRKFVKAINSYGVVIRQKINDGGYYVKHDSKRVLKRNVVRLLNEKDFGLIKDKTYWTNVDEQEEEFIKKYNKAKFYTDSSELKKFNFLEKLDSVFAYEHDEVDYRKIINSNLYRILLSENKIEEKVKMPSIYEKYPLLRYITDVTECKEEVELYVKTKQTKGI